MELLKRAKRFLKGLKKNAGFTLVEVTAVVAITGTLAAVVVPVAIDQIEKGRVAKANMDVGGISDAINSFNAHTGEWPDRTSATPNGVSLLRSGGVNANWAFTGADTDATVAKGTLYEGNVKDPDKGGTDWATMGTGAVDALVNHLTLDNPSGTTTTPNKGYRNADINWQGPYMPQVFNDPWGRNYLVFARAFTESKIPAITGTDVFVWVISGGPNKTLETNVTSPILNNIKAPNLTGSLDDIGKMMFKAREALPGVSGG